jgi:hypothetical protein
MSGAVWQEPDGDVEVAVGEKTTIVVRQGAVTGAPDITDQRGSARPLRIRPSTVGVRYQQTDDGWSMEIHLGGPTVRRTGALGTRMAYVHFYPGTERPPWWAARFALDHHPDPEHVVPQ